jgi:hypothetical protein
MNLNNDTTIGGIYEVCIGVTDAISAIQYWQQFGSNSHFEKNKVLAPILEFKI